MNAGTTLEKTDKGRAEIAGRSHALTAVQRRLLILVDGKKTVNDLSAFVRAGELSGALYHLQDLGLIASTGADIPLQAPVAPGFVASGPAELPRAAISAPEFSNVRAAASRFVREQLGDAGTPLCAAIDRCSSPHELRSMLRGIEVFVGQRLDAQTTQAFARHFGGLLL
ncbi:MAG: hypothetical protein ABI343_02755 [Burkholderiaceae bacterium]